MTQLPRSSKWHLAWGLGLLLAPVAFFSTRDAYFACNIPFPSFKAPSGCATIYQSMTDAQLVYFGSLVASYAALYALVSLNSKKISKVEAAIHLIAWTLAPPLWFSFERYFFFDPPEAQVAALRGKKDSVRDERLKALKEGQDYASKLWSAVLAVLIAFKLGEIVKEKENDSKSEQLEVPEESKADTPPPRSEDQSVA